MGEEVPGVVPSPAGDVSEEGPLSAEQQHVRDLQVLLDAGRVGYDLYASANFDKPGIVSAEDAADAMSDLEAELADAQAGNPRAEDYPTLDQLRTLTAEHKSEEIRPLLTRANDESRRARAVHALVAAAHRQDVIDREGQLPDVPGAETVGEQLSALEGAYQPAYLAALYRTRAATERAEMFFHAEMPQISAALDRIEPADYSWVDEGNRPQRGV